MKKSIRLTGRPGVTLIELLIVVAILGILAGLAVPNYIKMIEKNRVKQTQATLNIIYRAEGMYRLANGGYGTLAQMLAGTYLDPNPNTSAEWTFTIVLGGTGSNPPYETFTATATRQGGGDYASNTIELDQDWTGEAVSASPYSSKTYFGNHPLHD